MKFLLNTTMPAIHLLAGLNRPIQGRLQKCVDVSITFGDPRRNCVGTGVCKILSTKQKKTRACKGTTVKGYIRCFDNESLQIIINKNQMTAKQQYQYFSDNTMSLCTDMLLVDSLARALGIKTPLHLCAGKYTLFQYKQDCYFFVQFRTAFRDALLEQIVL